ncbi:MULTISPECIES: HupE/UreJ family protein [unclassified Sphingomonas]|uniref:HupE/UreJ family protein n=1 Tax=unclassified Sphingomonas TaxID=196159 RepID=UPI0022698F78|nr:MULTISPECIES: HupE/UreJ family protein [unclassified Sphingomonas]
MRLSLIKWLAALLLLISGAAVLAHALPGTAALLDFRRSDVGLELDMPLDQFELGFKHPIMDAPGKTVERYPRELPAYLMAHVQPVAPDGRAWRVRVDSLKVDENLDLGHADLVAHLTLTPPPGAPTRRFRFNYSVINHEVMTHTVLVFARSDWANGVFGADPQLLGTIRFITTGLDVNRDEGSFWNGFTGVFRLGMEHIADGTDHLLFLLALLLPAPLCRQGSRAWGAYIGTRQTLVRLAKLVTAFTLGHSLTLIIGVFGSIPVPARPVEVAIALSIFVSALHAWRPLLRGRETWVAAGFGLVHGLAFSQVIAGGGLDGWNKAAAVLGFNLGIESVQLLVVAAVVPWLMLLAWSGHYRPVRLAGAAFAAVASLGWALERISGTANVVSASLEGLRASAPWLVLVLAIAASLVAAFSHRKSDIDA